MTKQQLLDKLEAAWVDLLASYAGLSGTQLLEPGVTGDWSVKDILAHVTTWEEEALRMTPLILEGKTPPRYADLYGGLNAFNAEVSYSPLKRGACKSRALSLMPTIGALTSARRPIVIAAT